jgi:hypothetical protein
MENKPQENKELKFKVENKEAKASKKTTRKSKVKLPNLDPKKTYQFVSNGKGNLKSGLWNVTGEMALILLENGFGELKK